MVQQCLIEFIESYKSFPCLWKKNDVNYRNKSMKDNAYASLLETLRKSDSRANYQSVKRKINALKIATKREHNKINELNRLQESNPANKVTKKRRTPSLWYYDLMKFVIDQEDRSELPLEETILDRQDDQLLSTEDSEVKIMEFDEDMSEMKVEEIIPSSSHAVSPILSAITTTNTSSVYSQEIDLAYSEKMQAHQSYMPADSIQDSTATEVLLQSFQSPQKQEELEKFGAYVASKLKWSSKKQSIIAEKVISDVLMRASIGTLEENTKLTEFQL